jgi:hypothetical protein
MCIKVHTAVSKKELQNIRRFHSSGVPVCYLFLILLSMRGCLFSSCILEEKRQKAKNCSWPERERCELKAALALMSLLCVQGAFMSTVFCFVCWLVSFYGFFLFHHHAICLSYVHQA